MKNYLLTCFVISVASIGCWLPQQNLGGAQPVMSGAAGWPMYAPAVSPMSGGCHFSWPTSLTYEVNNDSPPNERIFASSPVAGEIWRVHDCDMPKLVDGLIPPGARVRFVTEKSEGPVDASLNIFRWLPGRPAILVGYMSRTAEPPFLSSSPRKQDISGFWSPLSR